MKWGLLFVCGLVGCGGDAFSGLDSSLVIDAAIEASEVDAGPVPTDARADMLAEGEASVTSEASSPEASTDAGVFSDVGQDAQDGNGVPSCGEEEVYPQASPTCMTWIATTQFPNQKGCCRRDTHTCGYVVTFSPFCVKLNE